MSKYIDVDKLIAKINEHIDLMCLERTAYAKARVDEAKDILNEITSLQQEQQKEICSRCIHYGIDDGYCYYPHGGMLSAVNENGVYECTGFCEKEQEQPEVDLEVRKQIEELANDWHHKGFASDEDCPLCMQDLMDILWHFYELGLNARKEEKKCGHLY